MDDAISRAKVFKFLNRMEEAVAGDDIISKTAMATIKCARRYVTAIPSVVDAVPVVRCAECVHRDKRYEWHGDYNCRLHHEPKSLDFFCADGKSREDGAT